MEGMRGLLRGTLGRSLKAMRRRTGWRRRGRWRADRRWQAHGEVTGYEDGVVQVVVSDKEWLQQLRSMSSILERELGKIAGVKVSGIHFVVRGTGYQVQGARRFL